MLRFITTYVASVGLCCLASTSAWACNIEFRIKLNTLGENVEVELRRGAVGSSRVVETKRSSGGLVSFQDLCAGEYFLAIGDGDSVSVTEPRMFEEDYVYTSSIVMQSGVGNVKTLDRGAL